MTPRGQNGSDTLRRVSWLSEHSRLCVGNGPRSAGAAFDPPEVVSDQIANLVAG
jgi:hypothetical protein